MDDTEQLQIPRPSQLWKQLSAERKTQAAEAFWSDPNASVEHAEAIMAIAQRIKFRPKSVIALSVEKKARHLVSVGVVSELVAARLLVAYHLAHQRPMMAAFLDALGIAHDEGLINEENVEAPSTERLEKAAKAIVGLVSRRGRGALPVHADVAGPRHLGRPRQGARNARRRIALSDGFDSSTSFAWASTAEGWVALGTLTVLEIVLGIDNIVFISILAGKLRAEERERARKVGLSLAMFIRIGLLLSITWVMGLTEPLFTLVGTNISGRDLILLDRRPVPDRQEHARDPRQARR